MEETVERIRAFIIENFLFGTDDGRLENTASFLDQGIIDSTGVLELVEWIEQQFGFTLEDEDLVPEKLGSVVDLAAFIESKRN